MHSQSNLAEYYALRANEYERIYQKPERQEDLQILKKLLNATFAGGRVLEIACGTGYWTQVLATTAASVVATDINPEVLKIAHEKSACRGRVKFLQEDAYALPSFSEKFTAGLAAFWWSHVPRARLRDFLLGFHKSFSPGATIVFMDNIYVEGSSTPVSRRDAEGNTYQWRKLDDGTVHQVIKNFPTQDELLESVAGIATKPVFTALKYYWLLQYRIEP